MKVSIRTAALLVCLCLPENSLFAQELQFGFGRVDITPEEPVRLSGYSSRDKPSEGIAQRIWTRAMALRTADGSIFVLANADTIGFPGEMTQRIAAELEKRQGITRDRFVLCATHSHATPHLAGALPNMFGGPLPEAEQQASERYTKRLYESVLAAVDAAVADLKPGTLSWGQGSVKFPINRRVLQNAKWAGFGETPDGVVDRHVPVLAIKDADGNLRGLIVNCACHCTTLGGDYYQVTGDWAGYAAEYLEQRYMDATTICTIGCGADANPAPRGTLENAQMHGRELATEVIRLLGEDMQPITEPPVGGFGYAGLAPDRPTIEEVKERLNSDDKYQRNHAKLLLETYEKMGRLPETYPCPVHVWRFGDQLGMVFLGGEVVADYAVRLRRELQPGKLWVSAYTDDVFAYVASERMRAEGGYEVDGSMIYYGRPGRWATGTEETLVRRVHELWNNPGEDQPTSAKEAMKTFRLAPELEIEQVAAEPLVRDPINCAFGEDGRLWVVEMGDYPDGEDGQGSPGGRVRFLEDADQDGKFDQSTVFVEGLEFPTAAMPWRDGVLVASAPEIFIARDTDGDGKADERKVILEGFQRGNPQHRVNGFDYGLDNWIYAGHGSNDRVVRSAVNGKEYDTYGRDFRFRPDTGELEVVGGHSGFVRSRDDWGHWFLGDNSRPIQHHVISDRYLNRNPYATYPRMVVDLMEPALNPAVFPASRTVDRFNDLSTANRFTSACSPSPYRASLLGESFRDSAFVCEPVHNLVHRVRLVRNGSTFVGKRYTEEAQSEFLASTDNWFRPVRAQTGPDGALWVCDMYRLVIEHTEWIPEAWQAQLDVRAGHDRGRIYRIYPKGKRPSAWPRLAQASTEELVAALGNDAGPLRDTAQRLLVHREDKNVVPKLQEVVTDQETSPLYRLHALATLDGMEELDADLILATYKDPSPGVRRLACELSERFVNSSPQLGMMLPVDDKDPDVAMQAILSLGESDSPRGMSTLGSAARNTFDGKRPDSYLIAAFQSSAGRYPQELLAALVSVRNLQGVRVGLDDGTLIAAALGPEPLKGFISLYAQLADRRHTNNSLRRDNLELVRDGLERRGIAWSAAMDHLRRDTSDQSRAMLADFDAAIELECRRANPNAYTGARIRALQFLGRFGLPGDESLERIREALAPHEASGFGNVHPDVQEAAIEALVHSGRDDAPEIALQHWKSYLPNLRRQVLQALLQRPGWVTQLLDAIEAGVVRANELDAASRDVLLSWRDEGMRARAKTLLQAKEDETRAAVISRYREVASTPGAAPQGAAVFQKLCATCHKYGDVGTAIGPDLASLTNKSDEALLVAILDPNRAVEYHYEAYTAVTTDGRVLSGLIAEQSESVVRMIGVDGKSISIPRSQIETLAGSEKSLMPEGLERDLSVTEMAHLLTYLRTPPVGN